MKSYWCQCIDVWTKKQWIHPRRFCYSMVLQLVWGIHAFQTQSTNNIAKSILIIHIRKKSDLKYSTTKRKSNVSTYVKNSNSWKEYFFVSRKLLFNAFSTSKTMMVTMWWFILMAIIIIHSIDLSNDSRFWIFIII